jgi:hypothetical protein
LAGSPLRRVHERLYRPLRRRLGLLLADHPGMKEWLKRFERRGSALFDRAMPVDARGAPAREQVAWRARQVADELRRACARHRARGSTGER